MTTMMKAVSRGATTKIDPSQTKVATSNCLGIPVRYDPSSRVIVDSRGMWRWKEIVIGPGFLSFPPREQGALLLHEAGHCKCNHIARLAWFIARSPRRAWRFARCALEAARAGTDENGFFKLVAERMPDVATYRIGQEFEADRFAAGCGYAHDLIRAFGRIQSEGGPFHPHPALRIARLSGVA